MKIKCTKCDMYLGEIYTAKIMKNIGYICPRCLKPKKDKDMPSFFKDIFKSK